MKFRKKPVEIEAVQWTGENWKEALSFIGADPVSAGPTDVEGRIIEIVTLEGTMTASAGDWIIRGVQGEYYPCKPDIFEATYEPVTP